MFFDSIGTTTSDIINSVLARSIIPTPMKPCKRDGVTTRGCVLSGLGIRGKGLGTGPCSSGRICVLHPYVVRNSNGGNGLGLLCGIIEGNVP